MALEIGDKAPDFKLVSDTGETVKLSDLRGKQVIVYFYPKDDTPGCTTQACNFRDHYDEITEKNGIVLGISPQDTKSHVKFKTKYSLPFVLLSDPDHKVAEAYGAWGERSLYGKKFMGIIRSQFVIDEKGKLSDIRIKVSAQESQPLAMDALA